jgi:MFS family permease
LEKAGTGQKEIIVQLSLVLRALKYRNFRLFFFGQSISLCGTWMQQVAIGWFVYRTTHSAVMLGLIGFVSQVPMLFFTPFGGVLADRLNRRGILLTTQVLSMLQAFALAFLVFINQATMPWVIFLSFISGFLNAFDVPARQSFFVEMIGNKEDLGNAIALNSSIFNLARLIGPTIAGILIALVGESACFLINGLSFLAVIIAILAMKMPEPFPNGEATSLFQELKEGFSYALSVPPIKVVLLFVAIVSLGGMPYVVLMPVFAKEILHGGSEMFGFLMGAIGLGALVGALYMAVRKNVRGLLKRIVFFGVLFGIGLAAFSLSRVVWVSLILLVITGCGMMAQIIAGNTVLQTLVDDDKRGRVMSLFATAFIGVAPFGSLAVGFLASKIGAPLTVFMGGVLCVVASLVFSSRLKTLRKFIREDSVSKGIVSPEI